MADDDLFGEQTPEEKAALEAKKAAAAASQEGKKKEKKPVVLKSQLILDVKPYDDETPLDKIKEKLLAIQMDGLAWGYMEPKELAYGLKKLVVIATIEDDKISSSDIEGIFETEDMQELVQSMDVASWNKL